MRLFKMPFAIVGFMTEVYWEGIVITEVSTQYWVKNDITGLFESGYSKRFYI